VILGYFLNDFGRERPVSRILGGRDQVSPISWIVIVYNISVFSLSVNSTLSIVCVIQFIANVSAINKSQFLHLNYTNVVPISIITILKNVFLKYNAAEWTPVCPVALWMF